LIRIRLTKKKCFQKICQIVQIADLDPCTEWLVLSFVSTGNILPRFDRPQYLVKPVQATIQQQLEKTISINFACKLGIFCSFLNSTIHLYIYNKFKKYIFKNNSIVVEKSEINYLHCDLAWHHVIDNASSVTPKHSAVLWLNIMLASPYRVMRQATVTYYRTVPWPVSYKCIRIKYWNSLPHKWLLNGVLSCKWAFIYLDYGLNLLTILK